MRISDWSSDVCSSDLSNNPIFPFPSPRIAEASSLPSPRSNIPVTEKIRWLAHAKRRECDSSKVDGIITRSDLVEYDLFTNAYQVFVNELNASLVSNYAGVFGWITGPLPTVMVFFINILGYAILGVVLQYPFAHYILP